MANKITVNEALLELRLNQSRGIGRSIEQWAEQDNPYAISTIKLAKKLDKAWSSGKHKAPSYYQTFIHAMLLFAAEQNVYYQSPNEILLATAQTVLYLSGKDNDD